VNVDEMCRECSSREEEEDAFRIFVGKPEGNRPAGRPRRGSEDNIEMDLSEIGWGCVDWIYLVHDRDRWRGILNTVMNFRVL
jgi:hypothetical protein